MRKKCPNPNCIAAINAVDITSDGKSWICAPSFGGCGTCGPDNDIDSKKWDDMSRAVWGTQEEIERLETLNAEYTATVRDVTSTQMQEAIDVLGWEPDGAWIAWVVTHAGKKINVVKMNLIIYHSADYLLRAEWLTDIKPVVSEWVPKCGDPVWCRTASYHNWSCGLYQGPDPNNKGRHRVQIRQMQITSASLYWNDCEIRPAKEGINGQ